MKKILILSIVLVTLCGCTRHIKDQSGDFVPVTQPETTTEAVTTEAATTEEATTEVPTVALPEPTQVSDEELNAMQRAVFNIDPFWDVETGTYKTIEEKRGLFECENRTYSPYIVTDFAYFDLNGDGKKEVIAGVMPGYIYVFYEINGQIYMDTKSYRGMSPIYDDGVYMSSGGASYNSYFRVIDITEEGVKEEAILYITSFDDLTIYSLDGYASSFDDKINGIPAEEGEKIIAGISTTEVPVYDFNRTNIETILSDWGE